MQGKGYEIGTGLRDKRALDAGAELTDGDWDEC